MPCPPTPKPNRERRKLAKLICKGRTWECLDPEDLCRFVAELSLWLDDFIEDYECLRIAVCNVEDKAFDGGGVANKRFCQGGGGDDPPPPPQPPTWG